MKPPSRILTAGLGAWLALASSIDGRADVPNGTYQISVPAEVVIVDPSGRYSDTVGGISMNFTLTCDDAGKITGAGTASANQSGVRINLDFTYTGSISGSGRATRITLTMKGTGTARYQGETYPVTYTGSQKAQYDPNREEFVGNVKVRVCVREGGRNACESASETVTFDVPGNDVGAWQSTVTVTTDSKNRTTGNGTLTLANNRRFDFAASGKYNPKRDQIQLKLAASGGGRAKLAVTAQPGNGVLVPSKLSGKVLGQTVKR